jgi:tetratricopeptide (TPR) repeat protein
MKNLIKRFLFLLSLFFGTVIYADINSDINNANLLLYQGKYAQAEEAYTQLMVPAADEFIIGTVLVDSLHIDRAITRLAQHKIDAAKEDIERAFHPQSSMMYEDSGYMLRARLRLMQGDRKGAFEDYDQLIKNSDKGMANGYRLACGLAQRAWAHLVLGEAQAAKNDFLTAISTDTKMLGIEPNPLEKPFWQAVVNEVIPLVGTKDDIAINQKIDAILTRQNIKAYPFSASANIQEKNYANSILVYEIYGPAFLLQEKAQKEKMQTYHKNVSTFFNSAQQALLKGDKQAAFTSFVNAFKNTINEDRMSRDSALQGISGIFESGFTPPLMNEKARRLAIQAQVVAQEKNYQEAAQIYSQAINEAPWVANLYYDHALLIAEAAQKNDDFNVAIIEMKRFIILSKNTMENREAQDRIYLWQIKRDRIISSIPAPYVASSATAGASDCFIATAAYGSFLDPHVVTLRKFRDHYLLTNAPGQWLVENYYHYSPPIANVIRENEVLRIFVRIILTPIIFSVEFPWIFVLAILSILLFKKSKRWSIAQ